MNPERWAEIRSLVERSVVLPPEKRSAFLNSETSDASLIAEVEEHLAYDRQASAMFSVESWQQRAQTTAAEANLDGTILGNYRLLKELGRGGMGAVYIAERADGVYQQKVALKVLQENIFTPSLADRFRQERQILARLQHPGIARLLDGGVMPDGRPYLVLEYVDGEPIDRYCDTKRVDVDGRLRLFLKVAEVVQTAHQQLVLHLDLKPANILVTPEGEPRLLDFGIARILSESEGGTQQAEATLRLLTPRYASPEQAMGTPLGVASDVFSLATLLYRLLTGVLPYPIDDANPLEAARMIREVPPVLPSQAAPLAQRQQLRGDIDTILLQALRKEPERRYATIAAFAADVQRHLDSEPVLAHTDSFGYRTRKFFRRNRAGVVASTVVFTVLTLSVAAVIRSNVVARRAQATAEHRLRDMRALAHSYIFDLDPQLEAVAGTVKIRHFVLQNAQKYLEAMSRESSDDDTLARDLAEGYTRIGQVQDQPGLPSLSDTAGAMASMQRGIAFQQRVVDRHPSDLKDLGQLMNQKRRLSTVTLALGDLSATQNILLDTWKTGQPFLAAGPSINSYMNVGSVAQQIAALYCGEGDSWNLADPVAALPWLDRAQTISNRYLAFRPQLVRDGPLSQTFELINLDRSSVLVQMGRPAEAADLLRESLRRTQLSVQLVTQEQAAKIYRVLLANNLLLIHDLQGANALIPAMLTDFANKGNDPLFTMDDAAAQTVAGRIDLESGRFALGKQRVTQSLQTLETLYKATPEDAYLSAELAWDTYHAAEEKTLDSGLRKSYYLRAITIAQTVATTHPEALSTAMLTAKCELGLAEMARATHNQPEQQAHTASAIAQLSKVLKAHPSEPEASLLLNRAKSLTDPIHLSKAVSAMIVPL